MKHNHHIDIESLITKYLAQEATDEEVGLLEDWVMASDQNKKTYLTYKEIWMQALPDPKEIDVDEDWAQMANQITQPSLSIEDHTKPRYLLIFKIAAIFLMLLIGYWGIHRAMTTEHYTLDTNQEIIKDQLPDGSRVALNRSSSIRYQSGEQARFVDLRGDAYFDVKRDTSLPFIVRMEDITVEVLGTSFYIDARAKTKNIEVIVTKGTVRVSSRNKEIILTAGQKVQYQKNNGLFYKSNQTDNNFNAWQSGLLTFKNTDLRTVVHDLNRTFHTNIMITNTMLNRCKITATFDHKSIDTIVNIITKTLLIKSEKQNGQILLSGSACQ